MGDTRRPYAKALNGKLRIVAGLGDETEFEPLKLRPLSGRDFGSPGEIALSIADHLDEAGKRFRVVAESLA